MVMLSTDTIAQIQRVADLYAAQERIRLKKADIEALARLKVTDPARYKAREERKFLVKTHYRDLGCVEAESFDTSTESLYYIELQMKRHGSNRDYDYYYYAPDGSRIELDLDWIPRVRCR